MKQAATFIAVALFLPIAALAQEDDGLPTIRALACDPACANSTPAIATESSLPAYPLAYQKDSIEAFVQLRYTVGTDGIVKDIVLMHLVGPERFAGTSIEALQKRKYTPATLNGQPTEQSRLVNFNFKIDKLPPPRSDVARAYDSAANRIKDQKFDEALKILSEELAKPELNFYERGMLDTLVALAAISKKDYLTARSASELPTRFFPDDLAPAALKNLMRSRIIADLGLNDVDDAVITVAAYKNVRDFDPADPLLKLVEDARRKIDAQPQFAALQRIPGVDEGSGRYFILSRRNFSFTTVSGSLDKFSLNCRQQTIESQITASAEWHVPKDWDRCFLVVQGAPGTVYQVNQFTN